MNFKMNMFLIVEKLGYLCFDTTEFSEPLHMTSMYLKSVELRHSLKIQENFVQKLESKNTTHLTHHLVWARSTPEQGVVDDGFIPWITAKIVFRLKSLLWKKCCFLFFSTNVVTLDVQRLNTLKVVYDVVIVWKKINFGVLVWAGVMARWNVGFVVRVSRVCVDTQLNYYKKSCFCIKLVLTPLKHTFVHHWWTFELNFWQIDFRLKKTCPPFLSLQDLVWI